MADKNVLIIGGGVAGLSAAVELANLGIHVELVEKSDFHGGTPSVMPARPFIIPA